MVVLTLVTQNNGETIFLDQAIPQVHFMKLLSCSLYNSWDTLKKQSTAILGEGTKPLDSATIPPGHYTLENLTELIDDLFPSSSGTHLKTKTNTAKGLLEIQKISKQTIRFSPDFAKLFGIDDGPLKKITNTAKGLLEIQKISKQTIRFSPDFAKLFGIDDGPLKKITNVKYLRYPSTYFIHCDLIDRNFNCSNNEKSDLLAKIDVKGKAYEKVRYVSSPIQPIRDCSTSSHVNSITISVKDENGELFDFNGMPLEFELELN